MGQCLLKLIDKSECKISIGLLGLDNAGKTTILYQLMENIANTEIVPTIGFNVETVKYGQFLLKIWDVAGGNPRSRALWWHYSESTTKAIIFVIDAGDIQRLPLATEELKWLWQRAELSQAVFLIFANKQDLGRRVLKRKEIIEILDLKSTQNYNHPWIVQECCALTGSGVRDGLQKLMKILRERRMKSNRCLLNI